MKTYSFQERLNFSEGVEINDGILRHIKSIVPASIEVRENLGCGNDRGTDYWVIRDGLPPLSVDMKNRSFCPIEQYGSDDACIETCSVFRGGERVKPGWTLDATKRTDWVVYTWPNRGGRRFWILSFPLLCAAALKHWREWTFRFSERATGNNGYQTLNVFVPRKVIAQAMREMSVGVK